jgi:predicted RNase H-like nuclease (RuvC/YqgF family)
MWYTTVMSDNPIIFEKIQAIAKLKEENRQLQETIEKLQRKISSLEKALLAPRRGLPWN